MSPSPRSLSRRRPTPSIGSARSSASRAPLGRHERELAVLRESGDADADQAERAGPVTQAAVEQLTGEPADLLGVVDADLERRRAAADREVGVAELRRHRAGRLARA